MFLLLFLGLIQVLSGRQQALFSRWRGLWRWCKGIPVKTLIMAVPSRCVNKAPKSIFRLQLEEEDRKARSAKVIPSFVLFSLILISSQKSLLDDVSDGEGDEEEGQRGLGDFGFGSMKELREMDEEKDALKLRRGDLDRIVDELSSDEEEGRLVLDEKTLATMENLNDKYYR